MLAFFGYLRKSTPPVGIALGAAASAPVSRTGMISSAMISPLPSVLKLCNVSIRKLGTKGKAR